MIDRSLERPSHAFDRKQTREPLNGQNCARVYNYAPGLVMLQIRGVNFYAGLTLTPDDVDQLIGMLAAARAEIRPVPMPEHQP
jgi:hypothetical protein